MRIGLTNWLFNGNKEKGFTIIEIIIVILLIAILSYVALFKFSSTTSSIKEHTLGKKVVSDVRYAQEMALNHRQLVKFIVQPSGNQYSLKWADDSYLKTPMAERDFIFDIDNSDFVGVDITSTGFSSGILNFDSQGEPLNNGTSITTETVLMTLDGQTTIKIVPETGRCYIQE